MKVDNIEHEKDRARVRHNRIKSILDWGDKNDYPQSVVDIVNGSYTGTTCLDIYHKFIYGRGFADIDNYKIVVNSNGDTADSLLEEISQDYATYGGFAIHVNRNLLGQITEMRHIPMENVRLCPEDDKEHKNMVALHPDWGQRVPDVSFNAHPIEYFHIYDPSPETMRDRIRHSGGIRKYKGEVYYYSNRKKNYPLPIFDSVLTDMSTQEAISNTNYRNARRAFLPAGCFAEINEYYDDSNEKDKQAFDEVSKALKGLQGDKNASSIMHVVVKSKDEIPAMVSLRGDNFDKEYTVTRESVRQAIGQAFRQPQELRCEKSSTSFTNDNMIQAYNVYNSITAKERMVLEREFGKLFENWVEKTNGIWTIEPLSYGAETILSRLGQKATSDMIKVATDTNLDYDQRKAMLILVYGVEENEAIQMLGKK